ncbi:MAG: BrnT family toxin [candidate division NC10 bacterium]|nr:BrnT family toxin [candidate division NC10 bacterium]
MRVAWDPEKAKLNLRKHGIHFSDAEGVLFDPLISARRATRKERRSYETGI